MISFSLVHSLEDMNPNTRLPGISIHGSRILRCLRASRLLYLDRFYLDRFACPIDITRGAFSIMILIVTLRAIDHCPCALGVCLLCLHLLCVHMLNESWVRHQCRRDEATIMAQGVGAKEKFKMQVNICIHRESNPELGHGKTQCYRYTMNACKSSPTTCTRGRLVPTLHNFVFALHLLQLAGRVHSDTFVEENMSASGAADSRQPATLTIAGTDPSGGAGIQVRWPRKISLSIRWCAESFENGQADLKTFTAHRCYGTSVVTALVAQNTTGVQGVHPCPPEFIQQQVRTCLRLCPVYMSLTIATVKIRSRRY